MPPAGQAPLSVLVEGQSEPAVRSAAAELRRVLEEVTDEVGYDAGADPYAKFSANFRK
jgi:hypothetical protein